jgi:hypothetical protein
VRTTLQGLIDETIDAVEANERGDGINLPAQSFTVAKRLLRRYDLSDIDLLHLERERLEMQAQKDVLDSWEKLPETSLSDFIAKAAERDMGPRYRQLLDERLRDSASEESLYAE